MRDRVRHLCAGAWRGKTMRTNVQQADMRYSAALCQVFDSIFYDVPMSRVKFNANTEYAYLQNFKILQSTYPAACTISNTDLSRHIRQAPCR
jgi:hypothetical protein